MAHGFIPNPGHNTQLLEITSTLASCAELIGLSHLLSCSVLEMDQNKYIFNSTVLSKEQDTWAAIFKVKAVESELYIYEKYMQYCESANKGSNRFCTVHGITVSLTGGGEKIKLEDALIFRFQKLSKQPRPIGVMMQT